MATGGIPPYNWKASSVPDPNEIGLYFNATFDALEYTPVIATTANVTLYLSDSEPTPVTQTLALPLVILPAPVATSTLLSTSNPAAGTGENVTFTATVAASGGSANIPAGPVLFYNGTTMIGTANLNATGQAAFETAFAAPGVYSITAAYGGNTNYGPSTSAPVMEAVVTPSVSASIVPGSLTLAPGASGTLVLTITPVGGYSGTVTFSCGSLPAHVSCTFAPPGLSIAAGSGSVTDTLTVSTDAPTTAFNRALPEKGSWAASFAWIPGSLTLLFVLRRRKRYMPTTRYQVLCFFCAALTLLGTLSGCGRSSSPDAKAGTYQIPISLTLGGGVTQTVSATVIVQ
jgi:hypothetical protein